MADIGPFSQIVDVHWPAPGAGTTFDLSVSSNSHLPAGEGTPARVIFDFNFDPGTATQEVIQDIDNITPGLFGTFRTYSHIVRIHDATKVTLNVSSPSATDLNFVGNGTITYTPATGGAASIDADIGVGPPKFATSTTADPATGHPTGVTLSPGSGSAVLVWLGSDAPRLR